MPNPTDFCNPCIFSERRGRRSLLWNCADIKSFQAGEHSSPLTVLQMISVVFADSRKGCPYDFVFQFVADDAHIVQKSYISLFAYGESVRRGRRTLRICREFVRLWMQYFARLLINPPSRLRRATSFSKEANEAVACCMGSFGKGAARRAED